MITDSRGTRFVTATVCYLVGIPAVWIVSASALFCIGIDRFDLFVFPYAQWIETAPWFHALGRWPQAVFIGSAAIPTTVMVICAVGAVRYYFRTRRPPLYGRAAWAGDAAMRAGGIRQSRRLPR
jgi:hypothetical protein